jgi:hypothetical protein
MKDWDDPVENNRLRAMKHGYQPESGPRPEAPQTGSGVMRDDPLPQVLVDSDVPDGKAWRDAEPVPACERVELPLSVALMRIATDSVYHWPDPWRLFYSHWWIGLCIPRLLFRITVYALIVIPRVFHEAALDHADRIRLGQD